MIGDDESAGDDGREPVSVLVAEAEARRTASDAALGRYRRSLNRRRAVQYPIIGAIVIALVVVFVVAYLHGEAHNTRLETVADAPATLTTTTPTTTQRLGWRTSDRAAAGQPVFGGTVVVFGRHTMRGIDARTGEQTWSYYRSNRTVCSAFQVNGIAVAVYRLAGNCDELTALDAGTGERQWTRTLDFNGLPVHGRPTFQLDVADATLLITTPAEIYSIAIGSGETGGENHFTYSHFGCRIDGAVVGAAGALISQTCTKPRCGTGSSRQKFCGTGPQLLLRPTVDPSGDPPSTNPNRIIWNDIGNRDVPISAGDEITAGNPSTGDLDVLGASKGAPEGSVGLGVARGAFRSARPVPLDGGDLLLWVSGRTSYVRGTDVTPAWSFASSGPPTVGGDGPVVVPGPRAIHLLQQTTGRIVHSYGISPSPPSGSSVYRLGSGFLVASATGTSAYV